LNLKDADAPWEDAVCHVFWEYKSLIGESVHAPAGLYDIKGELSSTETLKAAIEATIILKRV
jgi:hypothetical protein